MDNRIEQDATAKVCMSLHGGSNATVQDFQTASLRRKSKRGWGGARGDQLIAYVADLG